MTGLPNGIYYVAVKANPKGLLYETDTSNNLELRKTQPRRDAWPSDAARVRLPRHRRIVQATTGARRQRRDPVGSRAAGAEGARRRMTIRAGGRSKLAGERSERDVLGRAASGATRRRQPLTLR